MIFFLLPGWKNTAAAEDQEAEIRVNVNNGTLTMDVSDMALKAVLQEIGRKAGFKVLIYGFKDAVVTGTFTDQPLEQGIRRIVGPRSVAVLYQTAKTPGNGKPNYDIKAIWIYESNGKDTIPFMVREDENDIAEIPQAANQTSYDLNDEEGLWVGRLMNASESDARRQAITELARIGTEPAIVAIGMAYHSLDQDLRLHAAERLGEIETADQALGHILMTEQDPVVRRMIVRIFEGRNTETARSYLNSVRTDPDEQVQTTETEALEDKIPLEPPDAMVSPEQ